MVKVTADALIEDRRKEALAAVGMATSSQHSAMVVAPPVSKTVAVEGAGAREAEAAKKRPGQQQGQRKRLAGKTAAEETGGTKAKASVVKAEPRGGGQKRRAGGAGEEDTGVAVVATIDNESDKIASPNASTLDVEKILWGAPLGCQLNAVRVPN